MQRVKPVRQPGGTWREPEGISQLDHKYPTRLEYYLHDIAELRSKLFKINLR